jgi:hypothetical protein
MEAPTVAATPISEEGSTSTLGLVRRLTNDTKRLLKQEIELAKAELSEKVSLLARNSIAIATGGLIAYAGLIVFLIGLGWLVGWALQKAGVQPMLSGFIGLAIIGIVVAAIGGLFVYKGIKTLSQDTLAPERTIHSIQRLKGSEGVQSGTEKSAPKRPSKEIEAQVAATESRVSATLDTLGYRLSPQHINQQVKHRIQRSPYQSGLLAMAAGLVGGLFLVRGSRRS